MKKIEELTNRIARRLNIHLRKFGVDASSYLEKMLTDEQVLKYHAVLGMTAYHPVNFHFRNSSLAGSYFLGRCRVDDSIVFRSDIRGDELKSEGDPYEFQGSELSMEQDEIIRIRESHLIKTLVHSHSHNPERPELFLIRNTASFPYVNIHGSEMEGCLLEPFCTVDLTGAYDSTVGRYAYVQTGSLNHEQVGPGRIIIKNPEYFELQYRHPMEVLDRYIAFEPGSPPTGIFMDFLEEREKEFQGLYHGIHSTKFTPLPSGSSINCYALVRGQTRINENVLVAQRAYLDDAFMGKGSNAQENCFIVHSRLEGYNVMAHGAKVVDAELGRQSFVGFNSFLRGNLGCPLIVGSGCIVMPHTIVDLEEAVRIPADHLVWGYIRNQQDLEQHSIPLQTLSEVNGDLSVGEMRFQGDGNRFVTGFKARIEHILKDNGAYFNGSKNRGHAQKERKVSYSTLQPYPMGPSRGLYPTVDMRP